MQTMVNVMSDGPIDGSRRTQRELYQLGRKHSTDRLEGAGIEPEGWAGGLNELGYGPYAVHVEDTRRGAIHAAARALRATGRPVGLLVWWGAHAWVMTGFEATADPALSDDFRVTGVTIQDVWYPRVSSIWGESNPPDTLVPFRDVREDFIRYRRPGVAYPGKDGRFVLVLPVPTA
jgi:hypothetical protein